ETRIPDLVLGTPENGDRIAGRVRLSDGRPCTGFDVGLTSLDESAIVRSATKTDAEGRFALLAARDQIYTVRARDSSTQREAKRKNVHAGDLEIELVLDAATRGIELDVHDESGPVATFRVGVENEQHHWLTGCASSEPGVARVPDLPAETFYLGVNSPLHRPKRLGPFARETAPPSLDVVLELLGGVTGTVLAGASPVAGAEVHAHRPMRTGKGTYGLTTAGLATFLDYHIAGQARAGDDGCFFLPLRESGRYRL